ncbi:glutaminase a [Diaporthe sp. PMI_573]|nr:glutaminase a [Diaporthaceae sp. PMI_573]
MRLSLLGQAAAAALASASTLTPPILPLVVRNPYLSTWVPSRHAPWEQWPIFWTGRTVGFSVLAAVPGSGDVYPLLGRPQDSLGGSGSDYNVTFPDYLGATFDASTTNLTYLIAGPKGKEESLKLTLSFLSPITPTSTLRQSLPAAYLTVHAEGSFDVNVYVDLNGEWVTGNRDNDIEWRLQQFESKASSGIKTWKINRRTQQLLTEFDDRAEWGTLFFSAPEDVHHESGVSATLRKHFSARGELRNANDDKFRKIMDEEPVFAFSKSFKLGSSSKGGTAASSQSDSVRFTFALAQDPVVQFASARGLTFMRPFWATYFPTAEEMVDYHYTDFDTASELAGNYSRQLDIDAYASGSSDYRDIAALSARQVLGATQFSGTPDNPILFLKEISSNGNFQTVDVIFPAFPFFLYTNPRWLAYLLEPLLEHMGSGQYPNKYSMHDLGYHFPNATGHGDGNDEYMPLEECGNMLIMGLALVNAYKYDTQPAFLDVASAGSDSMAKVQATSIVDEYGMDRAWGYGGEVETNDLKQAQKWVKKSYKLWKQWTVYLIEEALEPKNQLSTDDFAGWLRLQSNLALKGIIGIRAMSEISSILGETKDAKYYREIADDYIDKWQELALSRDKQFPKLSYEWYGSWTTIYNLFADSLLCFHLPEDSGISVQAPESPSAKWRWSEQVPVSDEKKSKTFIPDYVYQLASDWYHNVMQQYGLPLDSRHLYTKSDWEFFAAAVTSRSTRTEILTLVAKWLNETVTDKPFTDLYETEGEGGYPGGLEFKARPVVGGHFAFLALERACGGKATEALSFLDAAQPKELDVTALLEEDRAFGVAQTAEMEL